MTLDDLVDLLLTFGWASKLNDQALLDLAQFLLREETGRQRKALDDAIRQGQSVQPFDARSQEEQTDLVVSALSNSLKTGSLLNPAIVDLVQGLKRLRVEAPGLTQTAEEQAKALEAQQLQQFRQQFYGRAVDAGLLTNESVGDISTLFRRAYNTFVAQGGDPNLPGFRQFDEIAGTLIDAEVASRAKVAAPPAPEFGPPPAILPGLRAQEERAAQGRPQPSPLEEGIPTEFAFESPQQQVIRQLQEEEAKRSTEERARQREIQAQQEAELASRGELAGQPAGEAAALQGQAGPKMLATEAEFQQASRKVAQDVTPQLGPEFRTAFTNWLQTQEPRNLFRQEAMATASPRTPAQVGPSDFGTWLRTRGVELFNRQQDDILMRQQRQLELAQSQEEDRQRALSAKPTLIQRT